MPNLHIDFETYSEADLKKVGPWAYSMHPSTRVLIMAYAFGNGKPIVWLPGMPLPGWVGRLFEWSVRIDIWGAKLCAWNDFFELCMFKNVLKWPVPPPKYWVDVAASAAALSLPRSLEECGRVLKIPADKQKDSRGHDLIKIFSIPKRHNGKCTRTLPEDRPEEFKEFIDYCIKDVISERYIYHLIKPLSPINREIREIDRTINLRGVRFDMPSVHHAIEIREKAVKERNQKAQKITGIPTFNIKSAQQFQSYLKRLGVSCENSQKEYLKRKVKKLKKCRMKSAEAAEHDYELVKAIEIIETRLSVAKSTLAKYDKLTQIVFDGRAYGLLRWHGAGTGRWSASLVQLQNLIRPSFKNIAACVKFFKYEDHKLLDILYGDALEALSSSIRAILTATPGNRLIVSDYNQIESRGLKWLAGDEAGLSIYREGKDIYKFNASIVFKVKYEDVTSAQRLIGKVIELACGYQGALNAFKNFADVHGVVIPDEKALSFVKVWRKGNIKIVDYWYALQDATLAAIVKPGTVQKVRNIKFTVRGSGAHSFLYILLPSGRLLAYHRPFVTQAGGRQKMGYWGVSSFTHKYCQQSLYGGKIAQNITEGIAYDRLCFSLVNLVKAGYEPVLTVHDEIICDVPKGFGSLEEFNKIMCTGPTWAEGLPIEVDGYEAERYRK